MKSFGKRFQILLADEFSARRKRNAAYSMRAFARDLGVSPTALSQALNNKRSFSKKNLIRISDHLHLSPKEAHGLLNEAGRKPSGNEDARFLRLSDDQFRLISDWYYLVLLDMPGLAQPLADTAFLSKRLGISELEVRSAVSRLERLGYLEIRNKRLMAKTPPLSTTRDVPSSAIRKYHQTNLRLAERSLHSDPVDLREFSSITMPVDLKNLKKAKDLTMKFKRRLARLLSQGKPTEVYTLAIQLFPSTQREIRK